MNLIKTLKINLDKKAKNKTGKKFASLLKALGIGLISFYGLLILTTTVFAQTPENLVIADMLYEQGLNYCTQNNFSRALLAFKSVLTYNPNNLKAQEYIDAINQAKLVDNEVKPVAEKKQEPVAVKKQEPVAMNREDIINYELNKKPLIDFKKIKIKPFLHLSEVYDDNITASSDAPLEDFITYATFGATASYSEDFKKIDLSFGLTREMFLKNDTNNNFSQKLDFDYQQLINKFDTITIGNYFIHNYEAGTFADAYVRSNGRFSHYGNAFNIDYTKELNKQNFIHYMYGHDIDIFSREGASDSSLNKIKIQKDYLSSSKRTWMYSYQLSNRSFSPGKSAQTSTFAAGLKQYLTKQLYFLTSGGLDIIRAYNSTFYVKPMASISIIDDINDTTNLDISLSKGYTTTPYTQDMLNSWRASVTFTRQPIQRLSYTFSVFYGDGKYIIQGLDDSMLGVETGFYYHLNPTSKIGLLYSYTSEWSSDATKEYTDNKITLKWDKEF